MEEFRSTDTPSTVPAVGLKDSNSLVNELDRQVARGNLFAHTALGRQSLQLKEVESFVYGVADLLLAKGVLAPEEITVAVEKVRREMLESNETAEPGVALRIDSEEELASPPNLVNCAERLHVCHAVCCKLDFALSQTEIESTKVKWDMGRPYLIRRQASGFCAHLNHEAGHCQIYADRPGVCRGYSCANDKRIWKDFDKMELNTEWIAENLTGTSRPRMVGAQMHYSSKPVESSTAEPISP